MSPTYNREAMDTEQTCTTLQMAVLSFQNLCPIYLLSPSQQWNMFKLNFKKITTDIGKIIWKILLGESIINFNKPLLPYQKYGRIGQKLLHKRFFHNRAFPTLLTDCRDMCRQRGSCVFVLNLLGGLTANLVGLVAASESTQLGKKLSP